MILMGTEFLWGSNENVLLDCGDGCTALNVLKPTELYILNGQILCYGNYISGKLLKK